MFKQVEDASQADRLLEKGVAPLQHAGDDVLDPGEVIAELPPHILLVGDQLAVDVVDRCQIVPQHRQSLVGDPQVLLRDSLADPERAQQLQTNAPLLIEGREDVLLQRSEPARLPEARALLRIALAERLGLLRQQ